MAKTRKKTVKRAARSVAETPELVGWALQGLQQAIDETRAKLAELEAQARRLRGAGRAAASDALAAPVAAAAPAAGKGQSPRKKRTLSADARRRIADAQKRRWAKVRAKATSSS